MENLYQGFELEQEIDRIPPTSPESFFNNYIRQRKPVVFSALPEELKSMQATLTNRHLRNLSGNTLVKVEERCSESEGFGKGKSIHMKLKAVLKKIERGSTNYYISTQDETDVVPPFLKPLLQDGVIKLRPNFLGHLIPSTVNMWMGNSKTGTSTGLHHDHHDNLYILLRGKKRFRLFPPTAAQRLYTVGNIVKIHSNGRINYEDFPTRADGALPNCEQVFATEQAKQEAQLALEHAEGALERGEPGAAALVHKAEARLDDILEKVLDSNEGIDFNDDYEDEDEEDEEFESENRTAKRSKPNIEMPVNFSQINDLDSPDLTKFPLVAGAKSKFVEICAGEMLYLPCGWFHEVTSYTTEESSHLAFNYWMHPPDCSQFDKPYTSDHWSNVFELEKKKILS